jgi:sugar-specific transcriptional regulator TrmB
MKIDASPLLTSLETYGFTQNEASIYLNLLKNIEATAFQIAKNTGIPRTTVYLTLESLKKQGFISQLRKNNIAYFTPQSPNQLLRVLKKKEEVINEIMPQIRALSSRNIETPTAKLFVGLEGIRTGLEDILETLKDEKIKQIHATSQSDLLEYLPKYFPAWLRNREELGVFTKLILPYNGRDYLKSNELREVRILPEKFPFTTSVTIYANKIAFFSLQEDNHYCVILESKSITEMFKQFFLFSWEMLGKQ